MTWGKRWNIEQLKKLEQSGKIKIITPLPEKKSKRAKYHNKKVEYDGKVFDSKKEYKRYRELELLLKKGVIGFLECQVEYELNQGGQYSYKYIADFRYVLSETGETIVEDTKGFKTREYIKKRRLMKKVHGITIKET